MAATGMGGGKAWVPVARAEREALVLDSVRLAVELGVDLNATNTDGRTALDGAQTLKYETVIAFLKDHGAKASGKPAPPVRVPN
jgi:ankyrin repeat protein